MYYLYLIYAEIDNIRQWKIGITSNLNNRFNVLKSNNPNISHIESYYVINSKEIAYKTESILKKTLKFNKIKGEWFLFESLNKQLFLELCKKSESNAIIHIDLEKYIKQY